MPALTMVYGKFLIVDADTIIPGGAVLYSGSEILAVGTYGELMQKYAPAKIYGSADMIVAPGFVNAHGHGRGLTDFQLGSLDDVLEAWKYRAYPGLDMFADTLWRSLQMLESGITSTMHNHNLTNPARHLEEFHRVIDAYEAVGIRTAFAPTLIDDNIVLYGGRDAFMKQASEDVQNLVISIENRTKSFTLSDYLVAVDHLVAQRKTDMISIIHGPLAPQWCRAESLQAIRDHAKSNTLRVHIHILQTVLQKEYARRYRPGTLVEDLEAIGLLGPLTTCGHAIWLTEPDIETLAATQTSITTHPSCNLRIQSGLSPVRQLLMAGIRIGIGMDDKTFNDQKDFFEEMRLTARLHRLGSYEMLQPPITTSDCYRMATAWGAEILGFSDAGSLTPGKKADIILLDYEAMASPFTYPDHSPLDLILYRGRPEHVHTVIVNGDVVMLNKVHLHIDRDEVIAKLKESLTDKYPECFQSQNSQYLPLKRSLSSFYQANGWYDGITENTSPYYQVHNRR